MQKTRVGFKLPKDINLIQGACGCVDRQARVEGLADWTESVDSGPRKGNLESKQNKRGFEYDA